jgi:hypothetical protein
MPVSNWSEGRAAKPAAEEGDRCGACAGRHASGVVGTAERACASLSDMALHIEKAFGVSMDTLMCMQNSYDIAQARRREKEIKVQPFKAPVTDHRPS